MKKANNPKKGRKPIPDKKERLLLFVEQSKIEEIGGKDETREVCYKAIDETIEKKKKPNP